MSCKKTYPTIPLRFAYPGRDVLGDHLSDIYGWQFEYLVPGGEWTAGATVPHPAEFVEFQIPPQDVDGDVSFRARCGRKSVVDPSGNCHRIRWAAWCAPITVTVRCAAPEVSLPLTIEDGCCDDGCVESVGTLTIG